MTALAGLLVSVCTAQAAELRFRPGDDMDAMARRLRSGDTLIVSSGVYTNGWCIRGLRALDHKPILIRGEGNPILRPSDSRDAIELPWAAGCANLIFEGLTLEGAERAGIIVGKSRCITIRDCVIRSNGVWGVQTVLSDSITVEGCRVYGSRREHGIYFSTTDRPVVRDCEIFENAGCGVHMNGDYSEGGDGLVSQALVERNVIYGNGRRGGAAVNMDGVEQSVVRENLIFGNLSGGIVSFVQNGIWAGKGNRFECNTIAFEPGRGRFGISFVGGSRDTVVRRNLVVSGKGPAVQTDVKSLRGLVSDGNVYWMSGEGVPFAIGETGLRWDEWRERTSQDGRSAFMDPEVTVTADHRYVTGARARVLDIGAGSTHHLCPGKRATP